MIDNLLLGIEAAFTIKNLLYCFYGAILGTMVGVLPGFGPTAALSILLPFTIHIGDPLSALIMMSAIYIAVMYAGSTPAILTNVPGEITSVVTALDGYAMTKKGKAGAALAIASIGSLIAGIIGSIFVFLVVEPAAKFAVKFGPAELTSLCFLSFASSLFLVKKNPLKSVSMFLLGIFLGMIGINPNTAMPRFTMGLDFLHDGINFAILAVSLFGFVELFYNFFNQNIIIKLSKFKLFLISKSELCRGIPSSLRGTAIGGFFGLLPGFGHVISPILSYAVEKKINKTPGKFGDGMIEGVAGPESANNASVQTSFVPMLVLGIPFNSVMSLVLASLVMYDIIPGPLVMDTKPMLFWGVIVSFLMANIILFLLNYPLVFLWIHLLKVNQKILIAMISVICLIGVYKINNNINDIFFLLLPLTIIGYILRLLQFDLTPILLGFVIGPLFEKYFVRSLLIHNNDITIFLSSPIALICLVVSAAILYRTFTQEIYNVNKSKINKIKK